MAQFIYNHEPGRQGRAAQAHYIARYFLEFFPRRQKSACLGLNGSGKSTLLKIMSGVDKDIEGEARARRPASKVGLPAPGNPCSTKPRPFAKWSAKGWADVQSLIDRFN